MLTDEHTDVVGLSTPFGSGEYISQSVWATRQDFNNWRESQKFAQAHGGGGGEDKACLIKFSSVTIHLKILQDSVS